VPMPKQMIRADWGGSLWKQEAKCAMNLVMGVRQDMPMPFTSKRDDPGSHRKPPRRHNLAALRTCLALPEPVLKSLV